MMNRLVGYNDIAQLIKKHDTFIITGHTSPDGDAIGSCFALGLAIKKLGKHVDILLEPYPEKYDILPGKELLYTGDIIDLPIGVLIMLDCADNTRFGMAKELIEMAIFTINIDHHKTNPSFADYNLIDASAAATGEVIYQLIKHLIDIDIPIATALYVAILSDTDGFRFPATSWKTMNTIGDLMATGMPFTEIYNAMMHTRKYSTVKLLGCVLTNLEIKHNGRIVHSYITTDILKSVDATSVELEGMVEYLLGTKGVEVAYIIRETDTEGELKISLRSTTIDVSKIASQYGGGGHRFAAGFSYRGELRETDEFVLDLIIKEL